MLHVFNRNQDAESRKRQVYEGRIRFPLSAFRDDMQHVPCNMQLRMVAKTVLDKIMLYKREELPRRKREIAESDLLAALLLAPPPETLAKPSVRPGVSLACRV